MKISGWPSLSPHKTKPTRFVIEAGFKAEKNGWIVEILPGDETNGTTYLPWLRFHPCITRAIILHDELVGEFGEKRKAKRGYEERELTWKESAVWLREAIDHDHGSKLMKWAFYHAVMMKKRLGL